MDRFDQFVTALFEVAERHRVVRVGCILFVVGVPVGGVERFEEPAGNLDHRDEGDPSAGPEKVSREFDDRLRAEHTRCRDEHVHIRHARCPMRTGVPDRLVSLA